MTEFYSCHKNDKKSLYGFGWRCFDIRDVCMDFGPCFKVYNLVSVHPKSMKLGQMTNLNVIFHVMVSAYRLVTIWNSPHFPVEFRNGLLSHCIFSFLTSNNNLMNDCNISLYVNLKNHHHHHYSWHHQHRRRGFNHLQEKITMIIIIITIGGSNTIPAASPQARTSSSSQYLHYR